MSETHGHKAAADSAVRNGTAARNGVHHAANGAVSPAHEAGSAARASSASGADFNYDYIIIGSGFGGSVSALRLSEKGYSVGVLEMGKRFNSSDFPKTNWNVRKYLWLPKLFMYGFQQITLLRDVLIFHGAGVGGGSLVYANTLLTPPKKAFEDKRWPGGADWQERLREHYETAKFMLGVTEARNTYPADELLRSIVDEDMGAGATQRRHTVGIYYGEPGRSAPDPYFGGEGPDRTGCITCGECMSGCRHNSKNTLDKNYLYLAERRGTVIHPETRVTDVRPIPGGGYEIHTVRSTGKFRRRPRVFRARGVVFSAGVLGTVKLLMQCKQRGSLPALSDQLGNYVRTNSESIMGVAARDVSTDYSHGIAISAGVHPDENTHVEIVRYGKGHNFMSLLTTYMAGGGKPWPRWLRWLGNWFRHPIENLRAMNAYRWAERSAIVLVMQPLGSYMRLRLRGGPFGGLTSKLEKGQSVPTYMPIANEITSRLAEKMNGTPHSILPEVLLGTASTAHILGGATMGRDASDGVCDESGRVFGYENMFVADGSVVPANLGVNPSLTITALSEYIMSTVPPKSGADQKPAPRPASLTHEPAGVA